MFSWNKDGDRVAIIQMNAELRHAQLEILNAQCATDRLRLRFSAADIARHAQRDILRKALSSANALHRYYSDVAQQVTDPESLAGSGVPSWNEEKVNHAIETVARYLHEQREHFRPDGVPLSEEQRRIMMPFFAPDVLSRARIVILKGRRVLNPPFYGEAREQGITTLPEFPLMTALTFEDVLVFHGDVTARTLFHGLVHAVQFQVLGLERYTELFVRGFLRTRSHITVALEAHAYALETKFAENPAQVFSVEEKVRLWIDERRY